MQATEQQKILDKLRIQMMHTLTRAITKKNYRIRRVTYETHTACFNCDEAYRFHAEHKCLYEPTSYAGHAIYLVCIAHPDLKQFKSERFHYLTSVELAQLEQLQNDIDYASTSTETFNQNQKSNSDMGSMASHSTMPAK